MVKPIKQEKNELHHKQYFTYSNHYNDPKCSVVLTNTNWSKLRGNQGAGAELVIGRNRSPVEEAIGAGRLERGRCGGSRRRGAGAHGRLGRKTQAVNVTPWTKQWHWNTPSVCARVYLDDGRVLRERACWLGRLTHSQVLDVAASEDDVLKGVISRRDGPVGGAVLGAEGTDWRGGNSS